MKFTKVNSHVRKTTINGKDYYIGKDYGTFGNTYYYYIEVDEKVIRHGILTLKSAKNILKNLTQLTQ